jgi:hypothetical protein
LAGFLDGFLLFSENNTFTPEWNFDSSSNKVAKPYIHSIALAMQDQVF